MGGDDVAQETLDPVGKAVFQGCKPLLKLGQFLVFQDVVDNVVGGKPLESVVFGVQHTRQRLNGLGEALLQDSESLCGDGDGLRASAPGARMKAVSGRITARWQASAPLLEPWEKLANVRIRDRIMEEAHGGRGLAPIREIPV